MKLEMQLLGLKSQEVKGGCMEGKKWTAAKTSAWEDEPLYRRYCQQRGMEAVSYSRHKDR
jgi:hypothetical protein